MRILGGIALLLVALVAAAGVAIFGIGGGWFGRHEEPGQPTPRVVPPEAIGLREARQPAGSKQILFGDLHVHTTFSFDAFLMSLPMAGGTGAHPPADACDFARYCSQLDFWSINDHAENLTRRLWLETIDSVRQCNAVAGGSEGPDLVTYLGWEWSQIGASADDHFGHKNVVLLHTDDAQVPARPIGATAAIARRGGVFSRPQLAMFGLLNGQRGRNFTRLLRNMRTMPPCPRDVPVRELPLECGERAYTPEELFGKLRDWGFPAIVIPHGTAWGLYTPPASDWADQLPGDDAELQSLLEVYSGHGNSEEYRDWRAAERGPDGSLSCPQPSAGYTSSCWKSGELIRARCLEEGESAAECERRATEARQNYVDAGLAGWLTAPGHQGTAWLDSGQCTDCFQPAFNYRPASSAQYILALRDFTDPARPKRFRLGLMGSSDNHTGRGGSGYKEFARGQMTEGMGRKPGSGPPAFLIPDPIAPASRSLRFDLETSPRQALGLFETERGAAYFLTGGLIAAHSEGRGREQIWNAMQRKEVYATSGPRILLWFDLIDEDGSVRPMGSAVVRESTPRFRVRAAGSLEQKPGCAGWVRDALGAERLELLCLGECHHPSDERRRITRLEVVRIRPQIRADEPIAPLIEDPWLAFPCPPDPAGCEMTFEDTEFAGSRRDSVYYVRAIEEESAAIHADPLRCTYDESGRCVEIELCNFNTPAGDDCLGETEQRAWSSPIFVDHARAGSRTIEARTIQSARRSSP